MPNAFETYEDFLAAAIKKFWDSDSSSKLDLLALLLASREAWQVALDGAAESGSELLSNVSSGTGLLKGAAGAATVTILLRTLLGGSLGMLLGGVSAASLVAVYAKNHERIWAQVDRYKEVVDSYRIKFDKISHDHLEERIDGEQRDLMLEGLMGRVVAELDEIPPPEGE